MKKKLMSVLLAAAMVASMAVGCGSDKKASSDSGDTKKTESTEKKTESNQILFNGSSTLAPVITSIATDFFDTYGTWDAYDSSLPKEDIAIYVSAGGSGQGTKAVIDGTSTFGMVARSVKDEEKEAIKDEKEYQVGIDALTIAVNPENPVTGVLDDLSTPFLQLVLLYPYQFVLFVYLFLDHKQYYKSFDKTKSARELENEELKSAIKRIYKENKGIYGAPRIHYITWYRRLQCIIEASSKTND